MADPTVSLAVGVEEEFHTVDLGSRRLMPRADALLRRLPAERFGSELQRSVVETNSRPFVRLIDLVEDLAALRRSVTGAADPLGLGIVAAGTVPVADPGLLQVTPDPRYENMLDEYRILAREQLICGTQVQVDVGDRDLAVLVAQRVAPWLPVLLALSGSSPFWLGDDTGYASYRTMLWQRWPTSGPLPALGSAAEYDAMVAELLRTGVISDRGMLYYDVRPSAHLPTIELRLCDAVPRVEDVALLAGLFRALVAMEIDALRSERQGGLRPVHPAAIRAMTWRAARAGLEGELVDPVSGRPAAAAQVVRALVTELRPTLEAAGDWELVTELTDAALARGSSARRQRAAYARGGMTEVVDLLLAETRANTEWQPGVGPARTKIAAMLKGYDASHDEAIVFDHSARGPYTTVFDALDRIGAGGLHDRERHRDRVQRDLGMYFHVDDEDDRLFPVDLIPRIVSAADWAPLQAGLRQRVRALEAFTHDAYGDRRVVRDGVLPEWAVTGSPGYRPTAARVPAGTVRCAVAGIDLVQDGAGRWSVLEDNLRVPSGLGYAMANRWLASRVLPELVQAADPPGPRRAINLLREALTSPYAAGSGEPCEPGGSGGPLSAALITSGSADSAYFEHRLLADELGVPLVVPADLAVRNQKVYAGDRRIEVLYRRLDTDELFGAKGADGRPLGPALMDAVHAGTLVLANAPGNGVADDKSLYAFVPKLITYYLGEEPLLDNVPTYLCRIPGQREEALDRLGELVAKPVDGFGGKGVTIGPDASAAELDEARAAILAEPERWIVQETVTLSTHPSFVDGRLEPRAVDLRAFVCTGAEQVVLPLALTRVAPAGSRIVNSSQGGGSKDTWLTPG